MNHRIVAIGLCVLTIGASRAGADQTLVFFRHGEKPLSGNGQITCQGLNRANALATVLPARFGRPTYLYAPNPGMMNPDPAGYFNYVRPLATIEPLAVKLGSMSVNTKYGYTEIGRLQAAIANRSRDNTLTFIAWEHLYLVDVVQNIMNAYGGGQQVPAWPEDDYDSIYVVRLHYVTDSSGTTTVTATFTHEYEGLNGQPTSCPF
jgi:hypothetical protein